ncbi:hypothetical protein OKA04_05580 [Luteolibacter flavescens]|uniref:Uncharacterized protein n=1 Tax=Luteolibacter flavescens TaxID=1859460 RepID=A0ABT3FKU8_9BACT|nr:hypothetical protein [Luteolibacter flavescens]MCW1884192.1 hypothetical protein [Luteolibacter flavescens]
MYPLSSAIGSLRIDRRFDSTEEIWEALLARTPRDRTEDPFWRHEDLFDAAFEHRFGPAGRDTEWCVLTMHRDVSAFMATISAKHFDGDFVRLLQDLLSATLPDEPVYLGVYEAGVTDYHGLIASFAVFRDRLWAWTRGVAGDGG